MSLHVDNPFTLFQEWLTKAEQTEPNDPNAMSLATVDETGMPNVRMVLLKEFDETGFVFYTNFDSQKGHELTANPRAALCLHWKSMQRQVRIQGHISQVSAEQADAYFASRGREKCIGAWASHQSHPLEERWALEKRIAKYALKFGLGPVPRPHFWGGYHLKPTQIEFWKAHPLRLHERVRCTLNPEGQWENQLLFP